LLAPLAPHLAEELWSRTGGKGSIHVAPWPEPSATEAASSEIELVVQVDGRVRDRVLVPIGLDRDGVVAAVLDRPNVARAVDGRALVRTVHVPDRLVNLVTAGS
jgi:leucyl-tRNA synthetase